MSTPPDHRPTEPLRPSPPPVVEERVVASGVDPTVMLLRLEDAIGSLRTGLTIVGVIAVAALGVAIYGLVRDEGGGSRSGLASDERVSQLEERVDRLSREVEGLPSGGEGAGGDSAALETRVDALERTVKSLADRPATDATQAIEELSGRIDALSRDVEELKQAQPAP